MTQSYLQVSTTTDSRQEAAAIAKAAVEERLAASAQLVGPVASTYWWEGEVESAEEWMVLFKTTHDRFEELARLIVEQHSYDTPEIVATPVVAGSADYLDWISDQTEDLPGDDVYESDDDLDDDIAVDELAEDDPADEVTDEDPADEERKVVD